MKLDITFLVDATKKPVDELNAEKEFVKLVVDNTGLGQDGVHVSVVSFGESTIVDVTLGETLKIRDFDKKVNGIDMQDSPKTRIDEALAVVGEKIFKGEKDRADAINMVVLITDGVQTDAPGAKDPSDVAEQLRKQGVMMVTVGVTEDISKPELNKISGDPSNVFVIKKYKELRNEAVVSLVATKICEKRKYLIISHSSSCIRFNHSQTFAICGVLL